MGVSPNASNPQRGPMGVTFHELKSHFTFILCGLSCLPAAPAARV